MLNYIHQVGQWHQIEQVNISVIPVRSLHWYSFVQFDAIGLILNSTWWI